MRIAFRGRGARDDLDALAAFANGDGGTGTEIFTVVQALYPVFQSLVTKIPTEPCT